MFKFKSSKPGNISEYSLIWTLVVSLSLKETLQVSAQREKRDVFRSAVQSLSPGLHPYLDTEVAPVYVVPQEEVACVGRRTAHFKQLHQVEKLAVDVSTHCEQQHTEEQFTPFPSRGRLWIIADV